MHATEVERAITATTALISELGLVVGEARIVGNSNKLGLRLLPCDVFARVARSEEHTSELQSHLNLVCRLLLEKKIDAHAAKPATGALLSNLLERYSEARL